MEDFPVLKTTKEKNFTLTKTKKKTYRSLPFTSKTGIGIYDKLELQRIFKDREEEN